MAPNFSSLNPKTKSELLPRHQAPILLISETTPDAKDTGLQIKLQLRTNPSAANSSKYEQLYTLFDGTKTEQYCLFQSNLDKYIKRAPLNTAAQKFSGTATLLTGNAKANWDLVLSQLMPPHDDEHANGPYTKDKRYDDAIAALALYYCTTKAKQDQRWFMLQNMGKLQDMGIKTYYNRIQQMNWYITFLPGGRQAFPLTNYKRYL